MIKFIYGVMNSAKTVNLICKAYELKQRKIKYACLRPILDNRTDRGKITSRVGLQIDAEDIIDENHLIQALDSVINDGVRYILIDEIQFFSQNSIDILANYSIAYNVTFLCYGLMTDFQTNLFPASKRLVELADNLYHIKSYCGCGNIATINARFDKSGKITDRGSQIEIGAEEKYITLCKSCYQKALKK